jgi:Uncharacterized protein SCO1/SenC/PrrC, involved in biogenesis of respiratory and photosynthetic systems
MTTATAFRSVALLLAVLACDQKPQTFNPSGLAGPSLGQAIPKPDFTLTATDGSQFNFRQQTEGKITLLFFGYTHCPDVCPVHLANIAAALHTLGPEVQRKVEVVFVTTDPDRDTPEVIRAWLDKFDPKFVGLRGTLDEVNAIQRGLKWVKRRGSRSWRRGTRATALATPRSCWPSHPMTRRMWFIPSGCASPTGRRTWSSWPR